MAQVIWTQKIAFYQSESLTEKGEKPPQIVELLPSLESLLILLCQLLTNLRITPATP